VGDLGDAKRAAEVHLDQKVPLGDRPMQVGSQFTFCLGATDDALKIRDRASCGPPSLLPSRGQDRPFERPDVDLRSS
jgi:urease beta subunit